MNNPLQLSLVNFKKGSYIIVEGKQKADHFYIMRQGNVRVSKEAEVVEEEGGNLLAPGDFFGVISTMSSHSHIETAQAVSDVALIAVHRDQFGLLIERNAPVALKIIQQFSKTLRYLDAALARLTLKGDSSEENVSHLFRVAEYYARQSQYNQAYYAYYRYIQHCPQGEQVEMAKERMGKIKPYAKVAYLDGANEQFTRSYPQNTMIFSESEPGAELFIIQKGSVKITKIINDNEVLLALLKAGDMFGEMALLEDKPRTASAIAHEDAVLLAVNKANFRRMVSTQPQMITRLTQILSERLWFIYKQLGNTQIGDPVGRMYDRLFIELERLRVPLNTEAYTFDFGPSELINLVGLPKDEGNTYIRKLFENTKLRVIDNKIHVSEVSEVEKQSKYFAKMEKIEKSRRQASLRHH
jgi:CRP-like cAMP-binding protein